MLLICLIYDTHLNFMISPQEPSGAPQALTVSATSSTSISVLWDPVVAEDRNGIIRGYRVNYNALPNFQMVTEFLNITKEQQSKRQTVTLDNLNEFTNYSIEVLAFTVFGNGPASVGQVVETLEGSKFYDSIWAVIKNKTSTTKVFLLLCLLLTLMTSHRQHCPFSYKRLVSYQSSFFAMDT